MKVQTIHAFCTRLLHQFPFEADVAARFKVLDEAATTQLLNDLTLDALLEGATNPDSALGKALATAITNAADVTFKEVIAETIGKRDLITEWTERAGGIQHAIDELTRTFGLAPGDSIQAVENEYLSASLIPQREWPELIDIFSHRLQNRQGTCRFLTATLRVCGARTTSNNTSIILHWRAQRPRQRTDQEACRCQPAMGRASQRRKGSRLPADCARVRPARAGSQRRVDHGGRRGHQALPHRKRSPWSA